MPERLDLDLEAVPPYLRPLASVATALGPWRESVVFIGGAVAPLLQTHLVLPHVRPTTDVDAVLGVRSYAASQDMGVALRALGFRDDVSDRGRAHRWIAPSGHAFDLVPAGAHLGATGSEYDQLVVETAVEHVLVPGVTIRHVTAPLFVILKWHAYRDRGRNDPRQSRDVEDILGLLVSRPALLSEIQRGSSREHAALKAFASELLSHPDCDDILGAHLSTASQPAAVIHRAREMLGVVSRLP